MMKRRQLLEKLNYALQDTDSQIQVSLLTEIADCLPDLKEEVLRKALVATKSIKFENYRLDALKSLVHELPPDLLPEALTIGKNLPSGINRVEALKVIAPNLPPDLLPEALDIARAFRRPNGEYCLALALSAIADKLPETLRTEMVLEALAAAESLPSEEFRDNVYRSNALIAVIDVLPEELRPQVQQKALDSARGIEEEWCRSISLADLAPKLPEALQAEMLQEALDAARDGLKTDGDWAIAIALPVLIPKLPPELLPEALNIARNILSKGDRAIALTAITARLPEVLPETLALIKKTRKSGNTYNRVTVLTNIAPNLPPELLPEAFSIAKDIKSERERITVLIALASPISKMPEEQLLPFWQTIKNWLLQQSRPSLKQTIRNRLFQQSQQSQRELGHHVMALAAVIQAIGGEEAVAEAVAIQDVERWQF